MTIQEIADYAMNEIAKYPTDMEYVRAVVEYAIAEARISALADRRKACAIKEIKPNAP